MKRCLLILVALLWGLQMEAQNLTTRYTYWDWLETKVRCKYTVLPNGHKHGTASYYREENGRLWGTETWQNNRFKGFKWLFRDGSVECEGVVRPANNSYMETNLLCTKYSLYRICNDGKRRLYIKSELYQISQPDALSERGGSYHIKSDNYGRYYAGSGISCNMDNWRVKSYSDYHQNGKIALSFQTSSDYKTETITKYDEKGNIISQQIYNVPKQTLTIKRAVGDKYVIKDNKVILTKDVDVLTESGLLLRYKSGSTFKNMPIQKSRKDFYSIMSCAQDTPSQNYVILCHELLIDEIETIIQRSEEISVQKEIAGRQLTMKFKYIPNEVVYIDDVLYLTESKDSLSYYSMSYISPYNEGIDHDIKAAYKGDELIHLSYSRHDAPESYSFAGPIVNNLPHGECNAMYGNYYGTIEYVGNYTNGVIDGFGTYTVGDQVYEGEFKDWRYNGRGKLIIPGGSIVEGVFVNGQIYDGSSFNGTTTAIYQKGVLLGEKYQYANGDIFIGKISGQGLADGTYTFANKDEFDGIFQNCNFGHPSDVPFETFSGTCKVMINDNVQYEGEAVFDGKTQTSVKDIIFEGQGKLSSSDGMFYEGIFAKGKFVEGTCHAINDQGDIYAGEIKNGAFHGKGKLTKSNGDYYEGVFVQGSFGGNGKVSITDKKGFVYRGEYADNQYNGEGIYTFASGDTIKGNSVNGVLSGVCELRYANGDIYKGELKNYLPNGLGEITYASGDRFVGNFANGLRSGSGTLMTSQNSTFVGIWEKNIKNGTFVVTTADGCSYNVKYKHGVCDKKMTASFANGDTWEGVVDNRTYKKGKYTFADGTVYEGTFKNGNILKVKVFGPDGKLIKNVTEYRQLIPLHQEVFK